MWGVSVIHCISAWTIKKLKHRLFVETPNWMDPECDPIHSLDSLRAGPWCKAIKRLLQ